MQALSETTQSQHADVDSGLSARRALAALPDRAQREAAAELARAAYCAGLKETRERKGVRLDAIAALTKVNESLFVALERGDVTRWPTGIYRRSFFRAYATAIGLPVDASVDEFVRLFPEESAPPQPLPASGPIPLRLGLAASPRVRLSHAYLLAAFVDLAVLLLAASGIMWWTRGSPATVLAATSLVYYVVSTAVLGSSAGAWWLRARALRRRFKGLRLAR